MGGYGSSRWSWHTKALTVEECLSLDAHSLSRDGSLKPGVSGGTTWSRGGKEIGNIGWHVTREAIWLRYTVTEPRTGHQQDYDYPVSLLWTECHYGGQRPWFECPGVKDDVACGRRVAKLYKPPNQPYFLCRHCYGLTYASCQESGDKDAPFARRIRQILNRLGVPGSDVAPLTRVPLMPVPPKPKGMRWKTYHRLVDELRDAQFERNQTMALEILKIAQRSEKGAK